MFSNIRSIAIVSVFCALMVAVQPAHALDLVFRGHVFGNGGQRLVSCWVNSVGPYGHQAHSVTDANGHFVISRNGQPGWYSVTAAYGKSARTYYYFLTTNCTVGNINFYLGNTN